MGAYVTAARRTKMPATMASKAKVDETASRHKELRKERFPRVADLAAHPAIVEAGISEGNLRNFESEARGVPERARGPLAEAFGLTRDQYVSYLAGHIPLTEALRFAEEQAGAPLSAARAPKGPLPRNHPEWADLCARAMEADRSAPEPDRITPEDLREVGITPFVMGPLDSLELQDVLDLARMIHRRRRP